MKKWIAKCISIVLIMILIFECSNGIDNKKAYADPITASTIGSLTYAYSVANGFLWSFGNGTSTGALSWIEGQVNSYLGGSSIIDKFGGEVARAVAGKLIIPSTLAIGIQNFITWLKEEFDIGESQYESVSEGNVGDTAIGSLNNEFLDNLNDLTGQGIEIYCAAGKLNTFVGTYPLQMYYNGNRFYSGSINSGYAGNTGQVLGWTLQMTGNELHCLVTYRVNIGYTTEAVRTANGNVGVVSPDNVISATLGEDYGFPVYPDVGYNWEGTIDGSAPDTNLEQLLSDILSKVSNNDLIVSGEVVEPAPAPTPLPTFEPYPPVDDILPGINTGIEIGNDLIVGQQAQTGAITQGLEGVQEAVGSLEGTLEAIADTPAEEDLPDFKFDLRELFPFCIPFDIYRLLSSFDAVPAAPHVQLPIVIDSINFRYNLDLDFSAWDPVAQAMRTAELIVYAIGLAWATGKVIKW